MNSYCTMVRHYNHIKHMLKQENKSTIMDEKYTIRGEGDD